MLSSTEGKRRMEPERSSMSTTQGNINEFESNFVANQEKRGQWSDMSPAEEDLIHRLHHLLGNRWGLIAARLPNRKAEEVETYWKTEEKRKFANNKLYKPICTRPSPNFKFDG